MALRLRPGAGPMELEALTSLSRNTVAGAMRQVKALTRTPAWPRAHVPAALLADRAVGAQAKVVYGLLQAVPGFRNHHGEFSYTTLSAQTRLSPNTLKRAIAELAAAGWVQVTQRTRLSPIRFTLGTPELNRSLAEAAMARRRLKRAKFAGEALMQEYLSLLIASDQFTDNARPGFLVSPLTNERLELDRFYPPTVGFEYHGEQHERASARFSQDEVDAQRLRDLIKAGICVYRGIHLVIVRAEDLSLQGMTQKIGRCLPLRDLAGHEPLIDLLEEASLTYRAAAGDPAGEYQRIM